MWGKKHLKKLICASPVVPTVVSYRTCLVKGWQIGMLSISGEANGMSTRTEIGIGMLENWGEFFHWFPRYIWRSTVQQNIGKRGLHCKKVLNISLRVYFNGNHWRALQCEVAWSEHCFSGSCCICENVDWGTQLDGHPPSHSLTMFVPKFRFQSKHII